MCWQSCACVNQENWNHKGRLNMNFNWFCTGLHFYAFKTFCLAKKNPTTDFSVRQSQWRLSAFTFIKNCQNKLHDFKPFQKKTSALSWSWPPLSTLICSQLFFTLYLPSCPTFTKIHFTGFPVYPPPCLFSLIHNSNVMVAFVLVFTASQVPIHSLPCLHWDRIEYHLLVWVYLNWLREHLEVRLTCLIPAATLSIQFSIVWRSIFLVWLGCCFFFSILHFWQLDVNVFTKPTFSSLFSALSDN